MGARSLIAQPAAARRTRGHSSRNMSHKVIDLASDEEKEIEAEEQTDPAYSTNVKAGEEEERLTSSEQEEETETETETKDETRTCVPTPMPTTSIPVLLNLDPCSIGSDCTWTDSSGNGFDAANGSSGVVHKSDEDKPYYNFDGKSYLYHETP